nr:hypothetical protein [Ideonella sp.]
MHRSEAFGNSREAQRLNSADQPAELAQVGCNEWLGCTASPLLLRCIQTATWNVAVVWMLRLKVGHYRPKERVRHFIDATAHDPVNSKDVAGTIRFFIVVDVEEPIATWAVLRDPPEHVPERRPSVVSRQVDLKHALVVVMLLVECPQQQRGAVACHPLAEGDPQPSVSLSDSLIHEARVFSTRMRIRNAGGAENTPTDTENHRAAQRLNSTAAEGGPLE